MMIEPLESRSLRSAVAGDANGDGIVDAHDFMVMSLHFNQSVNAGQTVGDFNVDGRVNAIDFNILATNFGVNAMPRVLSVSAVDGSNNFQIQFSSAAHVVDLEAEPIQVDDGADQTDTCIYVSGQDTDTLVYHVDGAAFAWVNWSITDTNAWTFGSGTLSGTTSGTLPYTAPPSGSTMFSAASQLFVPGSEEGQVIA